MTPRILERIAPMATTVADPFTLVADGTAPLAIASIVFNSSDSAEQGVGDRVR
jgi:hypothetical protein